MAPRTIIAITAALIAAVSAWASWRSSISSERAYELQQAT